MSLKYNSNLGGFTVLFFSQKDEFLPPPSWLTKRWKVNEQDKFHCRRSSWGSLMPFLILGILKDGPFLRKTVFFCNQSYLYSHLLIIDNIWPPEYYINFTIMSWWCWASWGWWGTYWHWSWRTQCCTGCLCTSRCRICTPEM